MKTSVTPQRAPTSGLRSASLCVRFTKCLFFTPVHILCASPMETNTKTAPSPLWALALSSVLPDLAEQDLEEFCHSVLKDQRIKNHLYKELLKGPRHRVNELADTDQVELCQVSHEWRPGGEHIGHGFNIKLVSLGALPFRIREAVRQLFRERHTTTYKTKCGKMASDGRYQLWVEVDKDTDLSDAFEVLEDAYTRALNQLSFDEAIEFHDDWCNVDITEKFNVQPDTTLYDAYDLVVNDQDVHIREALLDDCLDFFSADPSFRIPDTVDQLQISSEQVWIRKPRIRIVLV